MKLERGGERDSRGYRGRYNLSVSLVYISLVRVQATAESEGESEGSQRGPSVHKRLQHVFLWSLLSL